MLTCQESDRLATLIELLHVVNCYLPIFPNISIKKLWLHVFGQVALVQGHGKLVVTFFRVRCATCDPSRKSMTFYLSYGCRFQLAPHMIQVLHLLSEHTAETREGPAVFHGKVGGWNSMVRRKTTEDKAQQWFGENKDVRALCFLQMRQIAVSFFVSLFIFYIYIAFYMLMFNSSKIGSDASIFHE